MLLEERRYPPADDFAPQANAKAGNHDRDWQEVWGAERRGGGTWVEPFSRGLEREAEVRFSEGGPWGRGSPGGVKRPGDEGMDAARGVKRCLVVRRTGNDAPMRGGRDAWYHDLAANASDDPQTCPCEPMDAEDLL